jgi:hypothetical protein
VNGRSAELLLSEYDVEAAQLGADVADFLELLAATGLTRSRTVRLPVLRGCKRFLALDKTEPRLLVRAFVWLSAIDVGLRLARCVRSHDRLLSAG